MIYSKFRKKALSLTLLILSALTIFNASSISGITLDQQQIQDIKVHLLHGSSYYEGRDLYNEYYLNYAMFGHVRITIERTYLETTLITSDLLNEVQADVLYLVNLHERKLLEAENQAIISYIKQGHGIIGTHESLNPAHAPLAPLFGMNPNLFSFSDYNVFPTSALMNINSTSHPIFTNMPELYFLDRTITPSLDGQLVSWSEDSRFLLPNGSILLTSTDGQIAIIKRDSDDSRSVYFTHNPSESASDNDLILLYNSLVWTASSLSEGIVSDTFSTDNSFNRDDTSDLNEDDIEDTTTIVYHTITLTNDTEARPPPIIPAEVPVKFDFILFGLIYMAIVIPKLRKRKSNRNINQSKMQYNT